MTVRSLLLLATLAVVPGWAQQAPGVQIRVTGEPPQFRVEGSTILRRLNNPNLAAMFQLFVEGQPQQRVVGDYELDGGALVFRPKAPLAPEVTYRAVFSLLSEKAAFSYTAPRPVIQPTTSVERIFPSASALPENQLKFYIQFSAPMSKGEARGRVHLIEEGSAEVRLPLNEELWDRDSRRLTLMFAPNAEAALPLKAGKAYKLVVDKEWRDAQGLPLKQSFTKEFKAVEADRTPLDPKQWKVVPPAANSQATLVIDFPESLDAALLLRFIDVVDPAGKPVRGKVSLDNEEKRWIFSPDVAWQPGKYTLEVLSTLEDLAGNKIGRAADAERAGEAAQAPVGESVTIPFEIAQ
ncbi:MAG: hypothetical protein IT168_23375 [Bryobacterales bacterium]|nr:hypothetical protein [Bryobacterales bacterium]